MSWLPVWSYFQSGLGLAAKSESGEVLLSRVQKELRATVSREKDIERRINEEESAVKRASIERRELTQRITNLDENRVFLVRECTVNEDKLAEVELHRSRLKTQRESLIDRISVLDRSIAKNESTVKGASELKAATLSKIPKLEEQHSSEMKEIDVLSAKKRTLTEKISLVSSDRDRLESELKAAHSALDSLREQLIEAERGPSHRKAADSTTDSATSHSETDLSAMVSSAEPITTWSSDSTLHLKNEPSIGGDIDRLKEEIRKAQYKCEEVHSRVKSCEVALESKQAQMGSLLLSAMRSEKKAKRLRDMMELQQQTLGSLEESKQGSALALETEIREKSSLVAQLVIVDGQLEDCSRSMSSVLDEITALKEALGKLSMKKIELAAKIKQCLAREKAAKEGLKQLRKNRLAIRLKKEELAKEKVRLEECESSVRDFETATARTIRLDNPKYGSSGENGTLTVSVSDLMFVSTRDRGAIQHELSDVSHSVWNNDSGPTLEVYLCHGISYNRGRSKKKSSGKLESSDFPYRFAPSAAEEKSQLFAMHNYLKSRQAFGGSIREGRHQSTSPRTTTSAVTSADGLSSTRGGSSSVSSAAVCPSSSAITSSSKKRTGYGLVPKDVCLSPDSLKSDICDEWQMKQLILHCPSRTHMFGWRMYYSALKHGCSLHTFYDSVGAFSKTGDDLDESLVLIKSVKGAKFGVFFDGKWQVSGDYRGSIDCFVFSYRSTESVSGEHWTIYKPSGQHSYYVRSTLESITIGAGECPAIYLDSDVHYGRSMKCKTFGSPVLSLDSHFEINTIEVWGPRYD